MNLTKDQKLAIGAALCEFSVQDDNLRDLTADERAVALRGREKSRQLLLATGIQPTELKELGFQFIQDGLVE